MSCSSAYELNHIIDQSQRNSIIESPFKTAPNCSVYLDVQLKYRKQYLKRIKELRANHPSDTIMLRENYDYICINCPAYYSTILIDTTLYMYKSEIPIKKYEESIIGYTNYDFLDKEVKSNIQWYKNPERYGTDDCFDGSHTFYTVIYPSGKVESMYMRCFTYDLTNNK
jgi:cellulose biosynthesis protein BcsQ